MIIEEHTIDIVAEVIDTAMTATFCDFILVAMIQKF